jgi:hypothetical protein
VKMLLLEKDKKELLPHYCHCVEKGGGLSTLLSAILDFMLTQISEGLSVKQSELFVLHISLF